MLMLQTVIRCSIVSPRIAEPVYSKTWPVPPPTPIRAIRARMMSLALTPAASRPSTRTSYVSGPALEQALGREDHLDLAGADPEGERTKGTVGGRVRVAADDRHARLGQAELRADDVDDALVGRPEAMQRDPELGAVVGQLLDLGRRDQVGDRQRAIVGRDRMIGRGHGLARPANRQAALAQPGECLRAGDLVDEVQVDREDARGALLLMDDMAVPDLVDEGARLARSDGRHVRRLAQGPARTCRGAPGPR